MTVVIKRYASRKLYDTSAGAYVTLDDIARIVAAGRDVQVVDRKTGEDVTGQILVQIIAERETRGQGALPVSVLADLVRLYHDQASALTPDFLSEAVDAFAEQQKQVVADLASLGEVATDPVRAAQRSGEIMRDWQNRWIDGWRDSQALFGAAGAGDRPRPTPPAGKGAAAEKPAKRGDGR